MLIPINTENKIILSQLRTLLKTNGMTTVTFKVDSRLLHIYSLSHNGFTIYTNIVLKNPIDKPIEFSTLTGILDILLNSSVDMELQLVDNEVEINTPNVVSLRVPTTFGSFTLDEVRENLQANMFEMIDVNSIVTISKILDNIRDKSFEKYIALTGGILFTHTTTYAIEYLLNNNLLYDYIINYYMLPSIKRCVGKSNTLQIGSSDYKTIFRLNERIYFSFDKIDVAVESILASVKTPFQYLNQIDADEWKKLSILSMWDTNPIIHCNKNLVTASIDENKVFLNSIIKSEYEEPLVLNVNTTDVARKFTLSNKPIMYYNTDENLFLMTNENSSLKIAYRGED